MSLEHAREIDTCKSEFVDGREGVVEIDDSKLGGFLTTDVSLCRGKRAGRVSKTAKSIPRDESNVNLSALFRRGVKP